MALNLDTTFKLKAKVEGARSVQDFKKQLTGLDKSSKMSKAQLGKMNIEINRMARAAGNTTKGLRNHIKALTLLRERTEIGGRAYKRLGNEITGLKRKLKSLDGQAASTGQKLAGLLATVGMGRVLRGVVGQASNYQAEVTKAAAIEGGGNRSEIEQAITSTAQIAAGTPTEVAELATILARAGFDAKEISNSLNGIVIGAEATGVAFGDMGSIVSNNLRAFGLETENTTELVDILVATANSSNQSILDLGEALKYAAPIARTLGISVNDTAGLVALLANNGIKGSEAGTALRSSLTRLQMAASGSNGELLNLTRGNAKLTKAFSTLGAEILDANGNLKPMDEVILSLRDSFAQVENAGQKAEIAKALFGQEQGSKILALINQTDIDVAKLFETIRNSGNMSEQTRKNMDSFALTTKVLGGNFEILTNQIGGAFISILDPLAKILNELLTDFSKLPKPIKDFGAGLAAAGIAALALKTTMVTLTALGVKQLIFTKVAAAWALFTKAIYAAKVAMIAFNATNPVGWIILVVGAIGTLSVVIYNFRKQIMEFLRSVRDGIQKYLIMSFNALPKFIREFLIGKNNRAAGDDFKIKLPTIKVENADGANVLDGSSNLDKKDGGGIDEDTGNKQKSVLDGMKSALTEYQEKVNDVAGNIKNAMSNALQGMEDALVNFVMTGKLAFGDLARSIIQDMARIVIQQTIMKPFTNWLSGIFGFENGGVVSGGETVKKYAYGGIVSRPTVFPMKNGMGLMGEAGPEAVMPLKRGANGKLGVQASGGVGNIVVNVDASGTNVEGDETQGKQLGLLISAAVQTEIIQQQRPGGLLA